jgi:hypothetical protein
VYFISERRYVIHSGLFVGLFLLTAATTSFINHFYATANESCAEHIVLRKATGGTRYKEHFIFINTDNHKEERFTIKKALYNGLSEGGKLNYA